MLVANYYSNTDIRLEERPKLSPGNGEILVRVMASGICGTDVMEWYRLKKVPRVLGHEITGVIAETKSAKYAVGQRVFVSHHVSCDKCRYCLSGNPTACETLHSGNYDPGGYSEYVRVPEINVERGTYILPPHVSFAEGTMIEPLACALRGQKVIGVKKGQTVLVLGSGVSGLLNILVAKLKGARMIATDIDPYRLQKAKECGADEAVHAGKAGDVKAEKVIVCSGAYAATEQAFHCVDRKGQILFFAIPDRNIEIPTAQMWRNEITVTSSYGAAADDLAEALELISSGKVRVKSLITNILPLKKIQEGFNLVVAAKESLKVVLEP